MKHSITFSVALILCTLTINIGFSKVARADVATSTFAGSATFATDGGSVGIKNTNPLAPLHVGSYNANNSVASQILISNNVSNASGVGNAHAFSDSSLINRSGNIGYNSYDARIVFGGGVNYDHYAAFQALPTFNDAPGLMTNYYGLYTGMTIQANATIKNTYGTYVSEPIGGGSVTNDYGIYVEPLLKGTKNYAIYTAGPSTNYFGGSVGIGSTTPGSIFSIGNTQGINFSTATSSFSSTGGINLDSGCFAIKGVCIGGNVPTSGTINPNATVNPTGKINIVLTNSDGIASPIVVSISPLATTGTANLLSFSIDSTGLTGNAGWRGLYINNTGVGAPGSNYYAKYDRNSTEVWSVIAGSTGGEVFHTPAGASGFGAYRYDGVNSDSTAGFFRATNAQTGVSFRNAIKTDDGTGVGFRFSVTNNSAYAPVTNTATKVFVIGNGQSPATDVAWVKASGDTYLAGKVGVGTASPVTKLHVSNGANSTTTVTIGELGVTSSKSCVNMNQADGTPGSFFISNGAIAVENSYCK